MQQQQRRQVSGSQRGRKRRRDVLRYIAAGVVVMGIAAGLYVWLSPGGDETGGTTDDDMSAKGTIGIVNIEGKDGWYASGIGDAEQEIKGKQYNVEIRNAGADASMFMTEVRSIVERGIDALILYAPDAKRAREAVAVAQGKGIPVISVDVKAEGAVYYGAAHEEMGGKLGEVYTKKLQAEQKQEKILVVVREADMLYRESTRLESAVTKTAALTGYDTKKLVLVDGRRNADELRKQMGYVLEQYADASGLNVICMDSGQAKVVSEMLAGNGKAAGTSLAFFTEQEAEKELIGGAVSSVAVSVNGTYGVELGRVALELVGKKSVADTVLPYSVLE